MSIQTELDRLETAKNDIIDAVEEGGVSVPENTTLDGVAPYVRQAIQNSVGISINWRGEYDHTVGYEMYDGVSHNGSSYICISPIEEGEIFPPPDENYWQLYAAKGEDADLSNITDIISTCDAVEIDDNGFTIEGETTFIDSETGSTPICSTMRIPLVAGEGLEIDRLRTDKVVISGAPLVNEVTKHIEQAKIDIPNEIGKHNTATDAHNDIRLLFVGLNSRLNVLADSDDTTLDQMSEMVAYIKSNRTLIENVTTNKVNVSDIINNLTTNVTNKPLSAAQGVALKALIDNAQTLLNKKADDYSLELYNGTAGNPKPVKFATVNYSSCNSENGVAIKIGMVSGHGNGSSYAFLQDAIIRVTYQGGVEVDNSKYYGAAVTDNGVARQYGDIFWVVDTTNKIVDFYVLMGQYARIYQTPWKRLTYSSGGTVTQYTSCTVYSSGTKVWANNSDIALMSDFKTESWTFTLADGSTVTKKVFVQ